MNLVDVLEQSGLTGRGGAAFSTATKVRAAHEHGAGLLVNACDGEIGAVKDAFVVEHHLPELVRGATLVAGTRVRYAAHRGSATEARLRAAGLDVLAAPARYVSSEETSLISLAQGGLARPMTKRQPFVRGGSDSAGRRITPTVVLNAETVWRIAQVVERPDGAQWFRGHGLPDEPGPRLVAIGGAVPRPGVVETAAGVPLAALLGAAGADPGRTGPVIVGGLGGTVLRPDEAARVTWSRAGLAPLGGAPGPGVVHVLDAQACPVDALAAWFDHAAGESAGQCGPCMFGLPAIASDWHDLADGVRAGGSGSVSSRGARARLARRAESVRGRGACRFPDGVAGLASSALRALSDHLDDHARGQCVPGRTPRSSHEHALAH
ncbi:NADH-ubiquinone oxidoreductase-F iron-sulfur binding region domain-containing protein [Phycicoccus sp. Root101]|uniref:NADH-ubiquinone oxidoreductase-F iron-sulfur binding region domain-containing protein n=1 Tax=Phycicoccus sp. Root101 TaxID=1736421 RepID=UPI000702C31C|nr:NADH-ubiquinone oxidoreductase-F iron-sulfur binding region domain-containing protein [Phycicoccus sp. Root101]KQU69412.1 formate dehydrogenase [Phycicoccus sp. Root101]